MAAAKTKIITPKDENSSMTSGMKSLIAQLKRTTDSLQTVAAAYNKNFNAIRRAQAIKAKNPTQGMTKEEVKKYQENQKKTTKSKKNDPDSWANTIKKVAPDQQSHMTDALVGSITGIDPAILQSFGLTKLGKKAISATFNAGLGAAKKVKNFGGAMLGAGARMFRSKKSKNEETGSAIEASQEDKSTGILRNILKAFKAKDKDDKKEKEKEKKSGLMGGGLLGRALLAGIGGLLLSAARPLIKRLLNNMFEDLGMPNLGGAAAEVIADMLPGAVMGYTLTKSVKGALLGAGLSLGYYSIKRVIEDFKNTGTGEIQIDQDKNYMSSAMRGAFLGYVFGGKSLKAALLGAGISMGLTWITNRVDDFKRVAAGDVVAPKMLGPFPEAVAGGIISGALIGSKFGGLAGAAWGAVIGGAAGGIFASVTNFQSRLNHAKTTGEYTENTLTVAGIPIEIFNGMLMGGIGGFMAGGPLGAIAGALVGGAAGWIYGKIKDSQVQEEAARTRGSELAKTDPRFASQQKTIDQAENLKQTSKEIQSGSDYLNDLATSLYKRGKISQTEYAKYKGMSSQFEQGQSTNESHSEKLNRRMDNILGLFNDFDLNKDGVIAGQDELTPALKRLEELDGKWITRRFNSGGDKLAMEEITSYVNDKQQLSLNDLPHLESILKERLDLTDLADINRHSADQLDALNKVISELEALNRKAEDGKTDKPFQGAGKQQGNDTSSNTGTTNDTSAPVKVPGS
jgi:hypothetical protein